MKVLKDNQEEALRFVWGSGEDIISREVWEYVNEALEGEKTVSRASIINFLNGMVRRAFCFRGKRVGRVITTPSRFLKWMKRGLKGTLLEPLSIAL